VGWWIWWKYYAVVMKMEKWDFWSYFKKGGGVKENDGGVSQTMIYCKKFCNCHNVPPARQE
jgi:hypothetical protein